MQLSPHQRAKREQKNANKVNESSNKKTSSNRDDVEYATKVEAETGVNRHITLKRLKKEREAKTNSQDNFTPISGGSSRKAPPTTKNNFTPISGRSSNQPPPRPKGSIKQTANPSPQEEKTKQSLLRNQTPAQNQSLSQQVTTNKKKTVLEKLDKLFGRKGEFKETKGVSVMEGFKGTKFKEYYDRFTGPTQKISQKVSRTTRKTIEEKPATTLLYSTAAIGAVATAGSATALAISTGTLYGTQAATGIGLGSGLSTGIGTATGFTAGAVTTVGGATAISYGGSKLSESTAPFAQRDVIRESNFKGVMSSGFAAERPTGLKGFASDILPGGKVLFGDEKKFSEGAADSLFAQGYRGDQLTAGIEAAKRQRKAGAGSETVAIFSANVGSEQLGQQLVTRTFSRTKKAVETSYPKLRTFFKAGSRIAPAGAVEGVSISLAEQTSRYQDISGKRTAQFAGYGALTAGTIGGAIPALQSSSSTLGRKAGEVLETSAYVSDPFEKPADIFAEGILRGGKGRKATPIITTSFNPSGKATLSYGVDTTSTPPKSIISTPTRNPTRTLTNIPSNIGSRTNTRTPTGTPTNIFVGTPTDVPTRTPTPTDVPPSVLIGSPTRTPTRTPTNVPTTTTTPVNTNVPYGHIPGFTPFLQFGGARKKTPRKPRGFGYTPSFDALIKGITASKASKASYGGLFTGQGTRPIISKSTKKKQKQRAKFTLKPI